MNRNTIYRYWVDRKGPTRIEMVFLTQAQFDAYADYAKQKKWLRLRLKKSVKKIKSIRCR